MLELIELGKTLSKSEHKECVEELTPLLREAQVNMRRLGVPMIVVFEGWDCAGKGECISLLAKILDPRGFKVHPTFEPTPHESQYPFLWRFWGNTPAQGEICFFDRSWYQRVLTDRIDQTVRKKQWQRAYEQITCFERQLADGGTRIVKFFLHISKKEQYHRFKKFEADPHESWRVRAEDWRHHQAYDEFVQASEEMFFRTDSHCAPWHVISAENRRYMEAKVLGILLQNMQEAIEQHEALHARRPTQLNPVPPSNNGHHIEGGPTILSRVDLAQTADKKSYRHEIRALQTELREMHLEMGRRKIPAIIVYEGWDAAGKGGNIKRLVERLDPRGYDVLSVSKPTGTELQHHYLWRFWNRIPEDGKLHIFDRSWYGRVLVERVEGFCSEEEWKRSYQEINEFEEQLAQHGTVIVKFWLHIDKDEQANRFRAREETPHKRWKITEEDWRNREKWGLYEPAVVEMLQRTSTPHAPWTVIAGNDKRHARLQALRVVIERLESALDPSRAQ